MNINEINQNAPEGATKYLVFGAEVEYYKKNNGKKMVWSWKTHSWESIEGRFSKHYDEAIRLQIRPRQTRTKVEYIEIPRESVDMELIDKVFIDDSGYVSVRNASTSDFLTKQLYRRIETPITEREEFIDRCLEVDGLVTSDESKMLHGKLYDAGCRFVVECSHA